MTLHNAWLWRLKDWIDGRFMDKYQDYTPMMGSVRRGSPDPAETADRRSPTSAGRPAVGSVVRSGDRTTTDASSVRVAETAPMKCTGCGGKLGAQALGPSGKRFTPESIGMALAMRELKQHLRETGESRGLNPEFTSRDRSQFLAALDEAVTRAKRQAG